MAARMEPLERGSRQSGPIGGDLVAGEFGLATRFARCIDTVRRPVDLFERAGRPGQAMNIEDLCSISIT
jgi:hypothetical protein